MRVEARLTQHARRRMRERGIPEEAIAAVRVNYHSEQLGKRQAGGKQAMIRIGEWNGRNLKIWVNPITDMVITAAWEG